MRHQRVDQSHTSRSFHYQSAFLLSILLMIMGGCGSVTITFSRTPPPKSTMSVQSLPTTAPLRTPTPTPSAVSATDPAGWVAATSSNWCGYTFPQGQITGVRAQWTEPVISAHVPGAYLVTWVGVGGWGKSHNNIVQIGTRAAVRGGQVVHDVWYETLPPNRWYTLGTIAAGDSVAAWVLLRPGSTRQWDLSLVDLTTHQTFQTSVTFSSQRVYADFIVEDPDATSNNGPPYYPFPVFTPITINNAAVRYADEWRSIATLAGLRVTLVQSQVTLALASPLQNDTFTVKRIVS